MFRCSIRALMRVVSNATCTSGEPVSESAMRNSSITLPLVVLLMLLICWVLPFLCWNQYDCRKMQCQNDRRDGPVHRCTRRMTQIVFLMNPDIQYTQARSF